MIAETIRHERLSRSKIHTRKNCREGPTVILGIEIRYIGSEFVYAMRSNVFGEELDVGYEL
jgi:hypothetical protein